MTSYWQMPLAGLDGLEMSRREVGQYGEQFVCDALQASGYEIVTLRPSSRRGDLLAVDPRSGEIKKIEVKTSRLGRDGWYRWTLIKNGHTDFRHADLLALIALPLSYMPSPTLFLIPCEASELRGLRTAQIWRSPERYKGKLAQYRVNLSSKIEVM